MNKSYYQEYFELERNHWWFKVRGKIILLLIDNDFGKKSKENIKILNVGAATGKTSENLSKYGDVTSLEFDNDCCVFAKNELGLEIINGSILELPFANNSFDMVCAFDVIEHVENDFLAIAEMKRVCKDGGLITVTVPAFMSLWSHHDVVNEHYRRYTQKNLRNLFIQNDLSQHTSTYFNTILFIPIYTFRLITKLIPKSWIRSGAGSDATIANQNGFVNILMEKIFSIELYFLKFLKFPFGVSIYLSSKK
jgi:SAM-dependent methyltransferase